MPRDTRSSGSTRSDTRSYSSGPTRDTRSYGSTRSGSEKKKKKREYLGPIPLATPADLPKILAWGGAPLLFGADALGLTPKKLRGVTRAAEAVGSLPLSPYYLARHPKRSVSDIEETLLAIGELPYGIYQMRTGGAGFSPSDWKKLSFAYHRRHEGEGMSWTDIAKMMAGATAKDYQNRYGKNWQQAARDEPLSNFFDLLTVFGFAARGAALAGSAGRLAEADMPKSLANLWKESNRPGIMTRGEAFPRRLDFAPETGEPIFSEQPFSRSPLRRDFQEMIDAVSRKYGDAPVFGARARITRANASQLRRAIDRDLGGIEGAGALNGLSEAERSRLFWGAQMGDHSAQALRTVRAVLAGEYGGDVPTGDAGFSEWLQQAKQAGFGKALTDKLDEAIKVAEKDDFRQPVEGTKYAKAENALRQATQLSEDTIREADGFTVMRNDRKRAQDRLDMLGPQHEEAPALEEEIQRLTDGLDDKEHSLSSMFADRRGRLRDFVLTRANSMSPIRQARLAEMAQHPNIGPDAAQHIMSAFDQVAKRYQHGPAQWWEDRVGLGGESADDFMARVVDMAAQPNFQRSGILGPLTEAGEKTTALYSPMQRWVVDEMRPQVQARELAGNLRKSTRKEELEESGILNWVESHPPDEYVSREEVIKYLANPSNTYNLEEIHRSGRSSRFSPLWRHVEGLRSIPGSTLDYHQIVARIPEKVGRRLYRGKGEGHWEENNVITHLRFWDIADEPVGRARSMIVEEGQSDWLSQWLKARKTGELDPERQAYADRWRSLQDELEEVYNREDELDQLRNDMWDADGTPSYEELKTRYEETATAWNHDRYRVEDAIHTFTEELKKEGYPEDAGYEWAMQTETPKAPMNEEMMWDYLAKRILRYAAENKIERLVVPDAGIHRVRYGMTDVEWKDLNPVEVTRKLKADTHSANAPTNMFHRYYDPGRGLNKAIAKLLAKDGEWAEQAYRGRYSLESAGLGESKTGAMPGTVFKLSEADFAKHSRPSAAFQRQPDWNALPKGATEYLEGGRTRLHAFKDADVSTWIHELGHIALHDLDEADQLTLANYYGGGKPVGTWLDHENELYARDFERYFGEGLAPTEELKPIFAQVAQWIRGIWAAEKRITAEPINPEVAAVFKRMMANHEPDVFIPHRPGAPNLTGARTSRGIPRAQRDIGDHTFSRIPLFRQNKLSLLRSGMLSDDPRATIEHVNRVVQLARANQLREAVLGMAEPLKPGQAWNPDTQYLVKKAGRGIDKPFFDAIENADDPAGMSQGIQQFIDDAITDNRAYLDEAQREAWKGKDQLYVVDKKVVDSLFKNVTGRTPGATTKPATTAGKVGDAVLDSIRALLLYANPGFYVANMVGNGMMTALADPRSFRDFPWSMKEAIKAAGREDSASPLWHRMSVEMGRGPTSGGLSTRPNVLGRSSEGLRMSVGNAAEAWSHNLGRWGRNSGRVIDDSWRVMAWKRAARKRGYKTDAEIEKLFRDADDRKNLTKADSKARRDLNSIRDEAEQLMLDFDSMTPFERTWLTRIVFLYPFLKASAKWPVMYAGERPIAMGLLGQGALQGEAIAQDERALGPRNENIPAWMHGMARGPGGYWPVSSIAPWAAATDLLEALTGVGQPPEVGVQRPFDFLNPSYQLLADLMQGRTKFGQAEPGYEILRQEFPAPAYLRYPWKKPSKIYAERDWWNTLLRALRGPFEVNESEAANQASRR